MSYPVRWIAAICIAGLVGVTHAGTIEGRVVGVHDGDTITLLDATHRQDWVSVGQDRLGSV